jgi:hypothetical protein
VGFFFAIGFKIVLDQHDNGDQQRDVDIGSNLAGDGA